MTFFLCQHIKYRDFFYVSSNKTPQTECLSLLFLINLSIHPYDSLAPPCLLRFFLCPDLWLTLFNAIYNSQAEKSFIKAKAKQHHNYNIFPAKNAKSSLTKLSNIM